MKKERSGLLLTAVAILLSSVLPSGCATMISHSQRRSFPVKIGEYVDERNALVFAPKGKGPFATVVFNHGSIVDGWGVHGAIQRGYRLDNVCEKLATEGYFVFAPIREKTPHGKVYKSYEDTYKEIVLQAIDYVKTLPEVDNSRVALVGFSMGGLVSFIAAMESMDMQAVALLAPAWGRGLLAKAAKNADRLNTPLLVMVEQGDKPMILRGVAEIENVMRAHGKPFRLVRYNRGGGHELFYDVGYWWEDFAGFLCEHLEEGH